MCCFSGNISRVANTRIFARATGSGTQYLVYQMEYAADNDLAMILPLPTLPNAPEDAVRFIDLSGYPQFFQDLAGGFPVSRSLPTLGEPASQSTLRVQRVGSFDASFAPSRADFARLDARFRIADELWDEFPEYHDYGFAVFKLRAAVASDRHAHTVHPMAFEFPVRDPHLLFFPTVHIHNGKVEANAYFDHDLFCQAHVGWMRSYDAAQAFMQIKLTQGIVAPDKRVERLTVRGIHPNSDIVLELA
ncbi:MAG: hypothetical protein HY741_13960 [Chloroflexi bacterium]|nr:hypothetical protein [Chloroflexota bacterium]